MSNIRSRLMAYAFAAAGVALALAWRIVLQPLLGGAVPYATFYLATLAGTLWGGVGPGAAAALLGGAAALYFIVPPPKSFLITTVQEQTGFVLYLVVSALLLVFSERQRRMRRKLEAEVGARLRLETEERLLRQRFEVTLSSIGDGVIATDEEGRVRFLNPVAAELTGWSPEDALGHPVDTVFSIRNQETGAEVENPARRAIRDGRIAGLANHTVLLSKSGRRLPIDDSGAPMVDATGAIVGAVLVFRDVTAARAREVELQRRQRMIDLSHDAIFVLDPSRRIVSWNRGAREIYGYSEAEARGQLAHSLLQTRDPAQLAAVDECLRRSDGWDGVLVHTRKDGSEVVCESRQVLLRDAGGEIAAILEINRDITERKRAEDELRRTAAEAEEGRRTLEALLESIPEGLIIADAPDGRIRHISRHGVELTGRPREALVDTCGCEHPAAFGVYHADGKTPAAPEELPLARAIRRGDVATGEEWVLRRPDGESVTILCNSAPIRDRTGSIAGGLIAWRDVSERKRLEQRLREAAKLESLGVLAGGIAHDFNNLLTGVLGNCTLLLEDLPPGDPLHGFAQAISDAAERAARLTQQMLAYSGRGRFVVEPVDLSDFVRQTLPLIEASIPKSVETRLELAPQLPAIEADTAQLQQLVMNLVINAAEAIGEGPGRVTISTRVQPVDETYRRTLRPEADVETGLYVALEVTDTGCGMDAETIARIFEPFYTTKFAGRGLGLAAAQGIVRGHKGAMKVYSSPGQGTTFRSLFPAAAADRPRQAEAAAAAAPEGGAGTILVIDDEEIVRTTASSALGRLGYSVLTAVDGGQGIEVFRAMSRRISVVLLDMTMPGSSGEETIRALRQIDPGVAIVLSSGYSEVEALNRFGAHSLAGFLQKPYTLQTLAERVKKASAS